MVECHECGKQIETTVMEPRRFYCSPECYQRAEDRAAPGCRVIEFRPRDMQFYDARNVPDFSTAPSGTLMMERDAA